MIQRRSKPRSKRKGSKAALKRTLDQMWSRITKQIWFAAGNKGCAWCGKSENLQSDHIQNRWKHSTRWDVENCVILDVGCHLFRKKRDPAGWYEMVRRVKGDELLAKIREKSERIVKVDYDEIYQQLHEKDAELVSQL